MENNKIFNLLDKAIDILERCWKGYKPVAGVKPYEAGSCEKEMATQSDMSKIEEVIAMLDKAINFYDPTQARDESGRWASGAGEYGSNKSGTSFVTDAQEQILTNKTDVIKVIQDHHERALKNVTSEDEEPAVSDALDRVESVMEAIDQARQEQPQKFYEILGRASDKVQAISRQIGKSSSKAVSQNAGYFENLADAINEIAGVWSEKTSDTWNRKGFEIIKKLDKLIEFYDPSQERDASGKWSGSGGGSSGKTAGDGYVAGFKNMVKIAEEDAKGYKKDKKMKKIAGGLAPAINSKHIPILEKYGISIEKQGKDYRWTENNIQAVKDYIASKEK
jgi:hypothetical protein